MYRAKQSLYIFYSNYQILATCLTNNINNNLFSNIILRTTILNNTGWIIYDPIMGQIRPHVTNKIEIKLISLNEFMVAAPGLHQILKKIFLAHVVTKLRD